MFEFLRRNLTLVTSGLLLVVALVLISTNARNRRIDDPLGVGAVLLESMRPVQSGVTQTASTVTGLWRQYFALVGLRRENEALRQRILELEREAVRIGEIEQTNRG
jgi:rod shape-determining protein MreC